MIGGESYSGRAAAGWSLRSSILMNGANGIVPVCAEWTSAKCTRWKVAMIQPPDTASPGPIEGVAGLPTTGSAPRLSFGWIVAGVLACTLSLIIGIVSVVGGSPPNASGAGQLAAGSVSTDASREPNDPANFGYATVPNLIGLTGDQASAALSAADFRGIDFTVNYAAMSSTVEWQSPAPGTWWSKTSSVKLTLDPTTAAPAQPQPTQAYTSAPAAPATPYVEPSSTYTYKVTGRNRAMITYTSTGGNTSQVSSGKLPWSKSVDSPGYSGVDFAYVSAQNSGSGTISCQIVGPSGNVVSENSSEGPYAIVTCQK